MHKSKAFYLLIVIILFTIVLYACKNKNLIMEDKNTNKVKPTLTPKTNEKEETINVTPIQESSINENGETIIERYIAPNGFQRGELLQDSFGEYLRNSKLKPYGEQVNYYNGKVKKGFSTIYDSVFSIDIGDMDLHQCADAIMLLRAEYLYFNEKYDEISFNFVSGFKAEYSKWRQGYRIKVDGNDVIYYKGAQADNSYESFRKYMVMVMAYSSTLSLEKELTNKSIEELTVGDVFIIGGSPGHAIIVVDVVEEIDGDDKMFLLAQSYMPAQETQILMNNNIKKHSPWYSLNEVINAGDLKTPEWKFNIDQIKTW